MRISDFDFHFPPERIALYPPKERGGSRLLVLNRQSGQIEHRRYTDLPGYLRPGDVLVLNDTRVIKARLRARKSTGGEIELLLLEKHGGGPADPHMAQAIFRGHLQPGDILTIHDSHFTIHEIRDGIATIGGDVDLYDLARTEGEVPLPPYLHRAAEPSDAERYQTIFARDPGSVAAPTASLNLTEEILARIRAQGVQVVYLTLHVGLGTFQPVKEVEVEKHRIHSEFYSIPAETAQAIRDAKKDGRRVIAVGTTVTRALESAKSSLINDHSARIAAPQPLLPTPNSLLPISGEADIFIYPGYKFQIVDVLVTNFHAPRTTVLLLTTAFCCASPKHSDAETGMGWENLKRAYQEALTRDYQFLSYGDSMLIE